MSVLRNSGEGDNEAAHEPVRDVSRSPRSARERWGALPLGELHPRDRCAFCGDKSAAKKMTIVLSTNAIGYRCLDSVACLRRKRRAA